MKEPTSGRRLLPATRVSSPMPGLGRWLLLSLILLGGMAGVRAQVNNVTQTTSHTTLQAAIDAANPGDQLALTANLSEGLVTVNKNLVINGAGFALNSTSGTYGVSVTVPSVTIQNIAIVGAGTYGIHTGCGADNLVLTNVTVTNCGNSGIAINGSDNCVLTNLIVIANGGNGLSIANCNNMSVSNFTSSGNTFGSFSAGIGLYATEAYCLPSGINGFSLTGTVSITEPVKVYSEKEVASQVITGISGPAVSWAVGVGPLGAFYWSSKAIAYSAVAASFDPPANLPNTDVYMFEVSTGNLYVDDNPAGDATTPMLLTAAVTYAEAGKSIFLEPGTFTEPGQVFIDKNLTIDGAGNAASILKPGANTAGSGNVPAEAFVYIDPAATVTLSDFRIDGSGKQVNHAIQSRGALTVTGLDIRNIAHSLYAGRGIVFFAGTSNQVTNTTFSGIQRIGIHVRGAVATPLPQVMIDGITYTGKGAGTWLDYAVEVGGGGVATIQNSVFTDNLGLAGDGSTSAGVLATTFFGPGTTATVSNCYINNCTAAIAVGYDGTDVSVVTANNNDFSGNIDAITSTAPSVNGECNWYGTTDPATIAALMDGPVDYINWLSSGTDTQPGSIGFQPAGGTCTGQPLVLGAVTASPELCASLGSITVNITSGVTPYDFAWSGPTPGSAMNQTAPYVIANLDAGAYTITVTDDNGTTAVANATVDYLPVANTSDVPVTYYPTIQAAIDAAGPGETIQVCAGTYAELLTVNKPVDLRGNNYGIDPNTMSRNPETILTTPVSDPDYSVNGAYLIYLDNNASGTSINGFMLEGNNPSISSGVTLNGVDIDAAVGLGAYDGTGNLQVRYNIIQNLSYGGMDFYNYYNSGGATSGNAITNNKIHNVGWLAPDWIYGYGIAILIYNNFYAAIEDNVMTQVRAGVQTGNFYQANPGATASIKNNDIEATRRGIFYNLHYSNASPFVIEGNDIDMNDEPNSIGLSISSQQGAVSATILNNDIREAYAGIDFWNCPTSAIMTVDGGTITDCEYGVVASNYDGYNANAETSSVLISGVAISGSSVAGVIVKDNPLNSNNADITLTVEGDCEILGAAQMLTGILVSGPDATAIVQNNDASIHGFAIGIDVDGGTATITNNHIYDNGIGIRFTNGGNGSAQTNNFDGGASPDNGADIQGTATAGTIVATPNNIFGGLTYGVDNQHATNTIDATLGYWEAASGPGPVGNGSGVNVSANVDYCLWLDDVPVAFGGTGAAGVSGIRNISSGEYFCSLQEAIADPQTLDNHIIEVDPGVYTEVGQIVISKDLTIRGTGSGCNDVTFLPSANTGISGDARGWWLVQDGKVLNLEKVTLDGNGYLIWQAIRHKGSGSIDQVCFSNILYEESGPSYSGVAVAAFGAAAGSNVNVMNSTFSNIGRVGVLYFGLGVTGSIYNGNTYTGKGVGDWLDYAIEVGGGAVATIQNSVITNNQGVASSDGSTSAGILATTFFGPGTTATVTNCYINNSTTAIAVGYDGSDVSVVTANNNDLSGNTEAITSTAPSVNGECNWYGTTNPVTIAALMAGPVDYTNWLSSGTDSQPAAIGFQPVGGTCTGQPLVIGTVTTTPEICASLGSITVNITSGVSPYDFAWSGPTPGSASNQTAPYMITGLQGGVYTITVTDDNGTTATTNATVDYLPVYNSTAVTYHSTIAAAIAAASNNDELEVCAGTYTETLVINKPLTINGPNVGTPGTGTRGAEAQLLNCDIDITAAAGTVTLDGFQVYQTNTNADVILISGGTAAVIQNNVLERWGSTTGAVVRAITTSAGAGVKTIQFNKFTGDVSGGLFSGHKTWNSAIYVNGASSTVNISSNTFMNSRTALNLDDFQAGITISGNTFTNCGTYMSFGGTVPTNGQYVLPANDFDVLAGSPATVANLSNVNVAFRLDMTACTFDGILASAHTLANRFDIEARMYHRGRIASAIPRNGLVTYHAGNQYVISGLTTIQSAVDYATANDVINLSSYAPFNESVEIDLPVTLDGEGATCGGVIIDGEGTRLYGVRVLTNVDNVTLRDFKVQNTVGGINDAGIRVLAQCDNLLIDNVCAENTAGRGGFYVDGPVNGVTISDCEVWGSGVNGRGIVIWNGDKHNVTITNNNVHDISGCCGIELQDGNASGVTMTGNTVTNTGDSGMSAVGLNETIGNNTISNNTITNTGRFGLEIKNPDCAGTTYTTTVSGNMIDLDLTNPSNPANDVKDFAGIAVFRRAVQPGNTDLPKGVVVSGNTVSNVNQPSSSEGFGIVIEGIQHTVTGNTINNCDVGIQQQAGHLPAPPVDGNDADLADNYFGRGNTQSTCSNTVSGNIFSGNGVDTRNVGVGFAIVTNDDTDEMFCSIQQAIDDSNTDNGDVILVSAGTYSENVTVNKQLNLQGANYNVNCASGRGAESVITGTGASGTVAVSIASDNVSLNGFTVSNPNGSYGVTLTGRNNVDIRYNIVTDIGNNTTGSGVTHAVAITMGSSANMDNVDVSENCFSNIRGGENTSLTGTAAKNNNGSASAITAGFSTAAYDITDLTVTNNLISNVTACADDFNDGGKGAYGILVNVGANASFAGKAVSPMITGNEITNLAGHWSHGIGLEGETPGAQVLNNLVSNLSDTKPADKDAAGVMVEQNDGAATVDIHDNSFTNMEAGVRNVTATTVDAECNWFGSTASGVIAGMIVGPVDYSPWLVDGTDNSSNRGFQPVAGACTGIPVIVSAVVTADELCASLGSIDVTFSGAFPPYDLDWAGPDPGSVDDITVSPYSITGLSAGLYTITVTDDNGSTSTTSVTVQYLPVTNTTDNPDTYYATIQAAINAADPGEVITVCAGTYAEHVIVNKALDLRGPNYGISGTSGSRVAEALIVPEANLMPGDPWTEVVYINSDGVKFDGFKVSGDNPTINGHAYAGMNLEKGQCVYSEGDDVEIRNNVIEKATTMGIFAGGGVSAPHYTGFVAEDNKIVDIHDLNQLGYGFGMYIQATTGLITDNTVMNCRNGIQVQPYQALQGAFPSVVSGNSFSCYRTGIYYNYSEVGADAWTIQNNTVSVSPPPANPTGPLGWAGIVAETIRSSGDGGTVTNNTVNGTGASVDNVIWWGVYGMRYAGNASTSTQMFFTNNTVSNVELGFVHDATADIVFTGNNLSYSQRAIRLQRSVNSAGVPQATGGENNIDATGGNTFNGVASSGATVAQLQDIEDAIDHEIDESWRGFVRVKPTQLFVTPNSFIAPGTTTPSVQRAVNASAASGDVLHIESGAYASGLDATSKEIAIAPGSSPGCVTLNGDMVLTSGDDLQIEINGLTACTLFDQFTVNGTVTLGGADLVATIGAPFVPSNFDEFLIIQNDGADAVVGQFSQGLSIMISGYPFVIDYTGGDGNDVVLQMCTGVIAITSPNNVVAGQVNIPATVPDQGPGTSYVWSISNGTITSGQGTSSILYTAGAAGSLTIDVTVTDNNGCVSTGTKVVNVLPASASTVSWVQVPEDDPECGGATNCCTSTFCYEMRYVPAVSGTLTDYTTGFFVNCLGGLNPITSNQSCVMTDNSDETPNCAGSGNVLFNSSGNVGTLSVTAGMTYVLHRVCFTIDEGQSINITEDLVTDLTFGIDLTGGGSYDDLPTFTPVNFTHPLPPAVITPAGASTVQCAVQTDVVPTPPTVTDYCGNTINPSYTVTPETASGCSGTRTYTFTYTHCSGYVQTWTYTYTWNDDTVPVITLLGASPTYVCQGEAYVDAGATASDNCSGNITSLITTTGAGINTNTPGTYTVTYDVTDACGNAATQVTRTVIVHPMPQLEISLNGVPYGVGPSTDEVCYSENLAFTLSEIQAGTGPMTLSWTVTKDNVLQPALSGTNVTVAEGETLFTQNAPLDPGVYVIQMTAATDANGCSIDASVLATYYSITLTVHPMPQLQIALNGVPFGVGPSTAQLCNDDNAVFTLSDIQAGTGPMVLSWTVTKDGDPVPALGGTDVTVAEGGTLFTQNAPLDPGVYVIQMTAATDAEGCAIPTTVLNQYYYITLTVNTVPVFTACPSNITQGTDANACTAVVNYSATASGTPTPDYTYAFTGATTGSGNGTGSGSTFNQGVTTVTVTATNTCGAPTCTFTVTVNDDEVPDISCPANVTIECTVSTLPGTNGTATAADNCDATPSITYTDAPGQLIPSTWPGGTAIQGRARWGNSGYEGALFIGGTTGPVLNPAGSPVWAIGTAYPFEYEYDVTSGDQTLRIDFNTDNSYGTGEVITQTTGYAGQGFKYFSIFMSGNATRGITLNNFVVNGVSLGNYVSPATGAIDLAWENSDGYYGDILATGTITFTGTGPGGGGDEIGRIWWRTATPVTLPAPPACPQNYVINRVWKAEDDSGNASYCVQTITVSDQTAPTGTPPNAITGVNACLPTQTEADDAFDAALAADGYMDNCGGSVTAELTNASVSGTNCAWTVTYTFSVKDACNNVLGGQTYTRSGSDQDPATGTLPSVPQTVNACQNATQIETLYPKAADELALETAYTDDCGTVTATFVSESFTSGSTNCDWTLNRIYTISDGCSGNNFNVTLSYSGSNQNNPTQVGGPVATSSTVVCPDAALPPTTLPVVQDACGNVISPPAPTVGGTWTPGQCSGTITYTYTYSNCPGYAYVWVYTYTVQCQQVELKVFLEGPYNTTSNLMENDLNDNHVLPGQDKTLSPAASIQLFAPYTPFGQPYNAAPWNYSGAPNNTGMNYGDPSSPGAPSGVIPYPSTVVDWVLVTVRKDGILPAHNIWTCAGWVHVDGTVTFPDNCGSIPYVAGSTYNILVQHRNHLGVLTPAAVASTCTGTLLINWDFTLANSYEPTFRTGQKLVEAGVWAMLNANGEQVTSTAAINSADRTTWKLNQGALGYIKGDFDMTAVSNSTDETLWKINQNKTSGVIFY